MSDYPTVEVEEITDFARERAAKDLAPNVNLGDVQTNQRVGALMAATRRASRRVFRLRWQGNKIPRGAVVAGHVVAWTQHGQVTSDKRANVGTYERTVE